MQEPGGPGYGVACRRGRPRKVPAADLVRRCPTGQARSLKAGHEGASWGCGSQAKEGFLRWREERRPAKATAAPTREEVVRPEGRRTMQREFVLAAPGWACVAPSCWAASAPAMGSGRLPRGSPENWIGISGRLGRQFRRWLTERLPFLCHGLSLNLGGYARWTWRCCARSRVSSSSMTSVPTASTCRPAPTTASSTT
ncbi:hypothetical protein ACPA9J_31970 [Pseudomonas aeruginosa]